MKPSHIFTVIALTLSALSASAADFFSTAPADKLFNIGVRVGVNNSNRTFPDCFNKWNVNNWGTGFTAGAVVSLNFRDFISIQPGLFFDSRNSTYSYVQTYTNIHSETDEFIQLGHVRTYNVIVPIMAQFHFNLANNIRWTLEAGPYAQSKMHASDANKIEVISQIYGLSFVDSEVAKSRRIDLGVKIGTSLLLNRHCYLGIHYLAGQRGVWYFPKEGGRNKSWLFSVGYDF